MSIPPLPTRPSSPLHPHHAKPPPPLLPLPSFTTPSSPSTLPTQHWIHPTLFHDIPTTTDPVHTLLQKAFPFSIGVRPVRKLMTLHDAQLEFGKDPLKALHGLIQKHSYRAVAVLCATVLKSIPATDVDAICFWWRYRFVALEKLGLMEVLKAEMDVFGLDSPLTCPRYEQFENGGVGVFKGVESSRAGPLASWDIRVLWAKEPALRDSEKESLDRVFGLILEAVTNARKGGVDVELWRRRVVDLNLVVSDLLVEMGDLGLAASVLRGIVEGCGAGSGYAMEAGQLVDTMSSLVRVYLQLGDTVQAARWIRIVEQRLLLTTPTDAATAAASLSEQPASAFSRPDVVLMNRALLAIAASKDWTLATSLLTQLLEYVRSTSPTSTSQLPTIINNLSICTLYSGNVTNSLSLLEHLVLESPQTCGANSRLLFNLCTLYDLTDNSFERKRRLLGGVVAEFGGDDLEAGCLKLGV
ncbi:hypothetical protein HDU98_004803 [Podochytrium sp. JEL0797]|nr:hypothetical protein HDU98_004803 [Podochytrium sp. JEL0797]